ncbi:MAG: PIN domain nuclease [Alphaproteobacteria bacterium]|nr:PIN domain nuclease [Alphaproteobacteria bacterium]
MIFVDSSVWIDWFGGTSTEETQRLDQLLEHEPLVVGDLVLTEVLQGIVHPRQLRRAREHLLSLTVIDVAGVEIALKAADNYRALRTLGITPRGTVDTLIATRCIEEDWPLLTRDGDFRPFAEHLGLMLI